MTPCTAGAGRRLARVGMLLALATGPSAAAAADAAHTVGTGPAGYVAHTVDLGADAIDHALRLDASAFTSASDTVRLDQQTGAARWNVTDRDALSFGARRIDDEVIVIRGLTIGASWNLNRYWDGEHATTLNLAASRNRYAPATRNRLAAALIDRFPDQGNLSIGLSQGLPGNLTLSVSRDQYRYDKDPGDLAVAIAVLFNRFNRAPPQQAFTLAGFPDRTHTIGLAWAAHDALTLTATVSQTDTVIDQALRSAGVGVSFVNGPVTLGATVTRSASTEVRRPRGQATVIPASWGTYLDFRLGVSF